MENLVQAWLIRVEHFSAEVSKKRARLDEIREKHLDLHAVHQEEERLLARSSPTSHASACRSSQIAHG